MGAQMIKNIQISWILCCDKNYYVGEEKLLLLYYYHFFPAESEEKVNFLPVEVDLCWCEKHFNVNFATMPEL